MSHLHHPSESVQYMIRRTYGHANFAWFRLGRGQYVLKLVEQTEIDKAEAADRIRQRIFATHIAYGTPLVSAMRKAGYEMPSKNRAVALLRKEAVQEEMTRCFEELRNSMRNSREGVIAQLDDAIEMAHNLEQPAAVVAGIVAKAKVLGLMDKPAGGANMPSKVTIEWGEESKETIYEKSNPLLHEAISMTIDGQAEEVPA